MLRKIIHISAIDSPNVRLALLQRASGRAVTNKELVPGVLSYAEYHERMRTWDVVLRTVGLDGRFYEGAEFKLFPLERLSKAHELAVGLSSQNRNAKAIGVDPAEGGDRTAIAVVDEYGLIELQSYQTPDTNRIHKDVLTLARNYKCPFNKIMFDRGGGGKQIADYMRAGGFPVQTVSFAETFDLEPKRRIAFFDEKVERREQRYTYKNRRSHMYGDLSIAVEEGFAIPKGNHNDDPYSRLAHQLAVIPRTYGPEGELVLPPKNKPNANKDSKVTTLIEIVGHSPDEADALAIAVYCRDKRDIKARVGSIR